MPGTTGKQVLLPILGALALLYPWFVPNDYYIYVMSLAYIMAIAAVGLNLILARGAGMPKALTNRHD
jgi:branched-chain amino acid transport system permease protein